MSANAASGRDKRGAFRGVNVRHPGKAGRICGPRQRLILEATPADKGLDDHIVTVSTPGVGLASVQGHTGQLREVIHKSDSIAQWSPTTDSGSSARNLGTSSFGDVSISFQGTGPGHCARKPGRGPVRRRPKSGQACGDLQALSSAWRHAVGHIPRTCATAVRDHAANRNSGVRCGDSPGIASDDQADFEPTSDLGQSRTR